MTTSTAGQNSCFHCGLPLPTHCSFSAMIDSVRRPMCCPGCQAVAEAINQGGLDNYYRYRDTLAATVECDYDDQYSAYDQPSVQQQFVYLSEQGWHATELTLAGITCAACVWLIEHHLQAIGGIKKITVNLNQHRAHIQWDASRIQLSTIFRAIRQIGYRATPYQADLQEQLIERENRKALRRLGVAGIGMMQVGMYAIALYAGALQGMEDQHRNLMRWFSLLVATPVVLYSSAPFFSAAWNAIRNRHLTMDVPVSLAIGIAYAASCWATVSQSGEVYFDSVVMFTFFLLIGRYLEMRIRYQYNVNGNAFKSLLPPFCLRQLPSNTVSTENGVQPGVQQLEPVSVEHISVEPISVEQLCIGDTVLVKPGEIIPADGTITNGSSSVDESAFSGEYLPVSKRPGDKVIAGTINVESNISIVVSAVGTDSQLSAIVKLLERAQLDKPKLAIVADRVAGYFVLSILVIASAVALYWGIHEPQNALWITLSVLVVSCPCALSLATPAALTAATSQLRELGILISRGHVLQTLQHSSHIVFDKTGTLTEGRLSIEKTLTLVDTPEQDLLAIAAALEHFSEHPIARAFKPFHQPLPTRDVRSITGQGIEGYVNDRLYRLGSREFIAECCPQINNTTKESSPGEKSGQWIVLCNPSQLLAWFKLNDTLRPGAELAIEQLRQRGQSVILLTGDSSAAGPEFAAKLGISDCLAGHTPDKKLHYIQSLQHENATVVMVGDGVNDVPVIAAADVSIAMPNASDLTKANADCVLLAPRLNLIPALLSLANKTRRIILQNIGWALVYNFSVIPLAAMGMIPPYLAAIGMSTSSLIVILNALRLRRAVHTVDSGA